MTFLEFLSAHPDVIETLCLWGWCVVVAGCYWLVFGGER